MAIAYQEMLERRKHKRFQVQDDAIAVLRPIVDKRGPIIDISRGGLAFRYITAKESLDRSLKLDILLPDLSFYLGHLPSFLYFIEKHQVNRIPVSVLLFLPWNNIKTT